MEDIEDSASLYMYMLIFNSISVLRACGTVLKTWFVWPGDLVPEPSVLLINVRYCVKIGADI